VLQQQSDGFHGQVADGWLGGVGGFDVENLPGLGDLLGGLGLDVAEERSQRSQALVGGSCRALPIGSQPAEEGCHVRRGEVGEGDLVRWGRLSLEHEPQEQRERVSVGGDGVW
jgi:hypothetical protein